MIESRDRDTDPRDHQNHRFPTRPTAVTSHLSPTRTYDRTKAYAAAKDSAVTHLPPRHLQGLGAECHGFGFMTVRNLAPRLPSSLSTGARQ